MTEKEAHTVFVRCTECGDGFRRHKILFAKKESFGDRENGWSHDEYHEMLQCLGCDQIRYRQYKMSPDCFTPDGEELDAYDEAIFPDDAQRAAARVGKTFDDESGETNEPLVPENVMKMYNETIKALNANAHTLAGGGLRATVEAICLSQGIAKGDLASKINELNTKNLLTQAQADLLHEERYIGNAALHELATPTLGDLEDGLQIVEGLMNTIYVLPPKAKRMRDRREAAKVKKEKTPAKSDTADGSGKKDAK